MTSLLLRHRWLGNALYRRWTCTVGVPTLYEDPSPICPGCEVTILWDEIPKHSRYARVSVDRIAAEDLALRLDLYLFERALEARRAG